MTHIPRRAHHLQRPLESAAIDLAHRGLGLFVYYTTLEPVSGSEFQTKQICGIGSERTTVRFSCRLG